VFYRVFAMLAIIVGFAFATRQSLRISRASWPAMSVMIVTSVGMGMAYLSSVAFIPITVAAVLFYTYPIMIVLAAPFVARRAFEMRELAIASVAFVGIVLVIGPSFTSLDPRGLALALLGALFTACSFFAANRVAHEGVSAKLLWMHLGAVPLAAAVALMSTGLHPPTELLRAPTPVLITIIGYMLGSIGMIFALSRLNAAIAGLVFCLEPVVSALVAAIWLDERLDALQYAGGAIVIAAVIATIFTPEREAKIA